jgi:DHA1 family inner membrane transport protein
MGNAIGAALGGAVISAGLSLTLLPWLGAAIALVALLVVLASVALPVRQATALNGI